MKKFTLFLAPLLSFCVRQRTDIKIEKKNAVGKESLIKVNLKDIMKGKTPDVPVFEGDVVMVPESFF